VTPEATPVPGGVLVPDWWWPKNPMDECDRAVGESMDFQW
jgi:hypothetical protein